jgi:predicted ArsR family transcriptional regulator
LASGYAAQITGNTPAERLQSLGELLNQRRIPVTIGSSDNHPNLTTHACPYPNLAEEDQSICMMEKMMFSELIGHDLELTQCRLNGGGDCRFQTGS